MLNRLAYGATPDELERVASIGPQAYINEQLAPETIAPADTVDAYTAVVTNGVSLGPNTNWNYLSVTGRLSSSLLYIYMTVAGEVYLDNVQVRPMYFSNVVVVVGTNTVTNTVITYGPNLLVNGDFEATLTPPWTVSTNLTGSSISTQVKCAGAGSLHVVSSAPGSTQGSAIWEVFSPGNVPTNSPVALSYNYLPNPNSSRLTIRLSGSGVISSGADQPPPPNWVYVTQTGSASSSNLYIYLAGIPARGTGEIYLDDVALVAGSVAEAGPNLLRNADFESALAPTDWFLAPNMAGSAISHDLSHSGGGSLHVVASSSGSTFSNAIVQSNIVGMVASQRYTLSYWYWPGRYPTTVRLSGSGINSTPDATAAGLHRRLDLRQGSLQELRSWFCLNGVGSRRQLLEILTQFFENHFVTEYAKSADYLDRYYDDGALIGVLAANWEYRENSKWRACLMRPDCTFYDLLKISAESPAMIVYLDTVDSRGDGNNIANENYARELFELFTMGVDNGYEQHDIEAQSPFALPSVAYTPGISSAAISNKVGVWTFNYKAGNHGTNRAPILSVWDTNSTSTNLIPLGPKIVPARFGPPWAGKPYQLVIPRRVGTNSIQDGYDVIRQLANLPFTEEYISIKLCRLFVHDDFPNPTTHPEEPEYAFYDYTDPNRSAEAELVHQCMLAWENSSPRGNIRAVLSTIFNSELFRTSGGSLQKVKTPLEFVLSAVRALRSANSDGTLTANTDGNFSTQLSRMGNMSLFNRDAPDGYPESGPPWISAGTLAERLRFVQALLSNPTSRPADAGGATTDPVALLKKKLGPASWNNAGDVADYFLSIFFPAEGKANLDLYRGQAINFLNTADDGLTSSSFASLPNTGATYDTRVRGMVSGLMTSQRFQEQ
ncbi:MAG: hypothetical protein DME25_12915 [Verrucomicrobia bacterium]|nr:MAG: hypothetical protein DME25_12915 [Verrucomicrobiota bacterium]